MRHSLLLPFLSIASPLLFCITCLRLKFFLPLSLLTLFYAHLVVHVGRICVHIILTSLPFDRNSALFLAIAHITRGTNVSTYPLAVFIFLVLLFLMRLFSLFSTLHPNVGVRLRSEISLLPPSLVDPALIRGSTVDVTNLPKSTNPSMQQCALPKFPGAATAMDRSVIAPGDSYLLAAVGTPVTDPAVTEDLGVRVNADPIGSPVIPSPSDRRFTRSRWQRIDSFPNSVDLSLSDPMLDSVPGRFAAAGADKKLSSVLRDTEASPGSSVPETTVVVPSLIATPVAPSATDLVLGSSGPTGVRTASTDEASSTVPQQQGRTRLQNNIIQPKRLFSGMIRYVNFCATGEPESLSEAMHDPKWKHVMKEEFSALMKNGT
jgi:hypothetical protein